MFLIQHLPSTPHNTSIAELIRGNFIRGPRNPRVKGKPELTAVALTERGESHVGSPAILAQLLLVTTESATTAWKDYRTYTRLAAKFRIFSGTGVFTLGLRSPPIPVELTVARAHSAFERVIQTSLLVL